jgi:anaerobic magnesium-protoporphyrin IX monomethyl ester cyclase
MTHDHLEEALEIALIRPLATRHWYINNVPLNYLHLAAYLREHGHRAHILDQVTGLRPEDIDRHIRENHIGVIGIGCMTCEFPEAVNESRRLKHAHPGIKVVLGGAHPSGAPEECLDSGVVDYVVVGEGEIALTQLLDALQAGHEPEHIRGIWTVEEGLIKTSRPADVPDIETLPPPAYDLLDLTKYFQLDSPWHFPRSARAVQFISSRGCPYQCSYCHTIHGKKYRGLSPDKVLDQIERLVRNHGVDEFMMVDDIFNFDLERAKQICRGLVQRRLKIHLQFPNGVRGDRFDEELVALMKEAGTHFMAIAIETTSTTYQRLIRKNLIVNKAEQTILWAKKHGIEVSGFFMIGFPGETVEQIQQTIDFAVKAPLDAIFISIVSPFKGTVLRNDMLDGRFGNIDSTTLESLDQLFPTACSNTLSLRQLTRMQRDAYLRFYTRPRSLLHLGRKLTNRRNVAKIVRAIIRRVHDKEMVSLN